MRGYIDSYGQPKVNLAINGLTMDAIIDTGFDSDLCLPIQLAIQLGLRLKEIATVELADGTRKRELVFTGSVKFGDELKDARIMLTESEDALIGIRMLSGHILKIDFIRKEIEIE